MVNKTRLLHNIFLGRLLVLILGLTFISPTALAQTDASISLDPPVGLFYVGDTVSVNVLVSSLRVPINAIEGTLSFPEDILDVISVSKNSSVVDLCMQDRSLFINKPGDIYFAGVILNPGFQGDRNRMVTVNFKAKKAGDASIALNHASLLANDGLGTNVLTTASSALLSFLPPPKNHIYTTNVMKDEPTDECALFDVIAEPIITKVAPGELLPISVKLSNFGKGKRVDVFITYAIFNTAGDEIYKTTETVAVETTASFVKTIQVPPNTVPGAHIAKTSISYGGQLVLATAEFPFTVERKVLGFFQSDFYFYLLLIIALCAAAATIGHFFIKKLHAHRVIDHEYLHIPVKDRIFYEIISDIIIDMRLRVGDKAIEIAKGIDGLEIDKNTGRVLKISDRPSKIIALLVLGYEKSLGQKVSFSFRKN